MSKFNDTVIPDIRINKAYYPLIALVLVWVVLNLWSYSTYLPPTCDEGWYASTAYNFLKQGTFGLPIIGDLFNLGSNHSGLGRGYLLSLALIFKVFGVSIYSRFFSVIGAAALTLATYLSGKKLYNHRVGVWSAALTAFAWDVFARSHLLRPEIWTAVFVMLLPYLYWSLQAKPSVIRAILIGLVTAISIPLHPNGLFFAAGLSALFLLDLVTRRLAGKIALAGLAAVFIASVIALLTYLLPDIQQAATQWTQLGHSPADAGPISLLINTAAWAFAQYLQPYGIAGLFQALYLAVGIVLLIRQRDQTSLKLSVLIVISLLLFALLKVAKQPPTTVLWTPLFILLFVSQIDAAISTWVQKLASNTHQSGQRVMLALSPLLLLYIAGDFWLAYKSREENYYAYVEQIQQVIPRGAHVMGEASWWFGFQSPDYNLLDDFYFQLLADNNQFESSNDFLTTEFHSLGIEYVILDGYIGCTTVQTPTAAFVTDFVETTCTSVGQVTLPHAIGGRPTIQMIYHCPADAP